MTLFRLKSNTNTIVEKDGNFHKVVWSKFMESGKDTRWMMRRWNPDNVTVENLIN